MKSFNFPNDIERLHLNILFSIQRQRSHGRMRALPIRSILLEKSLCISLSELIIEAVIKWCFCAQLR